MVVVVVVVVVVYAVVLNFGHCHCYLLSSNIVLVPWICEFSISVLGGPIAEIFVPRHEPR